MRSHPDIRDPREEREVPWPLVHRRRLACQPVGVMTRLRVPWTQQQQQSPHSSPPFAFLLILLLIFSIQTGETVAQLSLPKAHLHIPGAPGAASALPKTGASISKSDDQYLIKAHVGQNELKFIRLGDGSSSGNSVGGNSAQQQQQQASRSSPAVVASPINSNILVSWQPLAPSPPSPSLSSS